MNFSPLMVIVALGTISIVIQRGNAATVSELEAKVSAIQASLGTICNSIDTATTHCCYNPDTFKMFCTTSAIVATAMGIDTSTAGVCDKDATPCNGNAESSGSATISD